LPKEHLRRCPRCRTAQAIVRALQAAGEKAREADLSDDTVRETRRRVAEILERRSRGGVIVRLPRRRVLVAAAAVLVLGLAAFLVVSLLGPSPSRTGSGPDALLAGMTPAELEAQIDLLRQNIRSGIRGFHVRRRMTKPPVAFGVRSRRMKSEMEMYASSIRQELGMPVEAAVEADATMSTGR
jgi:hypothetical protein